MRKLLPFILLCALPLLTFGQTFTITDSDASHISLRFELNEFSLDTVRHNGELMYTIATKGIVAPNEYGMPDLPTFNRFIAIPQGATAVIEFRGTRSERMEHITIAPSYGSRFENDPELPFHKDSKTYATDATYPESAVVMAAPQSLRGVDVVHLGICPIQFNPVRQEITVNRQFDIDIRFEGGNGHFGDDRLRSPYWDPILQNNILNYNCLPAIDYDARRQEGIRNRAIGCEYLILTPDNDAFISAAQDLANYRIRQGIDTKVMSIGETGATTTTTLRNWFRDIYSHWDIPPVAVCILADHGENLQLNIPAYRTLHPIEDFVNTDNPYADVDDDRLPDMCFSRIVAQNESELSLLIGKQYEYEYTNPVQNLYYYTHPLTAAAWQNPNWFQITIATISGYLSQHGKTPVRVNELYSGEVGSGWSTSNNTSTVVNYFGPNGLGYIPATPGELGGWTGGTATQVIHAINSGAYLIQHRDHGWTLKWYQPEIYVSDFGEINNPGKMSYLISVNCKTGQFDYNGNCFTEALLRMTRDGQNAGIVGAISPSGRTYSFANDIFLWGLWDLFDPEFLPDYGPYASHIAQWMPSFASVSGKYFLEQAVFPNTDQTMRHTTFNAYHAHGDAFLRVFTEMPQAIVASHDPTITAFSPFHITAPEGVQIALSCNYGHKDHLLATATGTGQEQTLYVMDYAPTNTVRLTLTGLNYLRHEEDITLVPISGPFVVADSVAFNGGEPRLPYGQSATVDLSLKNVGSEANPSGTATLANTSGQMQVSQAQASYPALSPDASTVIEDAFRITLSENIPDGSLVPFTVTTQFNGGSFEREFSVPVVAPNIIAELISIDDQAGNGNGYLDPGDFASLTFHLTNTGHYDAENPHIALVNNEGYVRVITPETAIEGLVIGASTDVTIDLYVEYLAGEMPSIELVLNASCGDLVMSNTFNCPIGFTSEGFESGSFNTEYWTNDPEHPWQIVNLGAFEGIYCAQSDTTITHNESSQLSFTYTSNEEGDLEFYSKVSSENNYDFLVFYIDEEEQARWSGTVAWYNHSFHVRPGRHVYTWLYTKDHSVNTGQDCAWIDYITLPPFLDKTAEHADNPLTLHPNPTTDQVTIGLEQEGKFVIHLFDANGRLILTEQGVNTISFRSLPSGLYNVVVEQNGQRWSRRIIKM